MRTVQPTFRKVSEVLAPVDQVWERVTTPEGINHEMGPYLKMTMPKAFRGKSIGDVSPGTHIGKSLLLLFGVIPFGYDDITIAQIEPGRMFREESAMTGMRNWIHQRTLESVDGKTVVTDAITLAPRLTLPGLTWFLGSTLAAFFAHRHRRLKQHFASA
jgi:ligand-binding SRPBCC domain-containing protein